MSAEAQLRVKRALRHSFLVLALMAAAYVVYARAYFVGIRSSDGANYATVGRNHAEGRGLVSSVIQPGLIGIAPTDRHGQAFLIQAPFWPLVIPFAFKVTAWLALGESPENALIGLSRPA